LQARRSRDQTGAVTDPAAVPYELLDVVNLRDVRTTAQVAEALSISERDALRQLRLAEAADLVVEEHDESRYVPSDFDRQYWMLTPAGRERWNELDAQRED
jgi:hypothetical protein